LTAPRLLLLDDDAAIVAVVKRYFEGRGFEVETRADADAALVAVESERPFDAVVCDLHFTPACLGEGFEIVGRARAARPEAAVLLFTAAVGDAVRLEALRRGADDVVTKPTPLAALHDATQRAMKKP
jgi:two-component system phosphate regulon response regulator PhoB